MLRNVWYRPQDVRGGLARSAQRHERATLHDGCPGDVMHVLRVVRQRVKPLSAALRDVGLIRPRGQHVVFEPFCVAAGLQIDVRGHVNQMAGARGQSA